MLRSRKRSTCQTGAHNFGTLFERRLLRLRRALEGCEQCWMRTGYFLPSLRRALLRQSYTRLSRSADHQPAWAYRSSVVCGRTSRFLILRRCSSSRTTTSSACCTRRAISWSRWGFRRSDGKQKADPREVWRIFAKHYYPVSRNADAAVDRLCVREAVRPEGAAERGERGRVLRHDRRRRCARRSSCRARCLSASSIEVLATTDAAVDSLEHHKKIRGSDGRDGWCRRSVRMRWWMRSTRASARIWRSWARWRARMSRPGRAI